MKGKEHRKELVANLRTMKPEELAGKEREAREQLFWLGFKRHSAPTTTPMNMRKHRRQLARIKTVAAELALRPSRKEKQT